MRNEPITKELREYSSQAVNRDDYMAGLTYDLDRIADRIDQEHERRMADSRREMRRAAVRYMRSVFDDYYHGIKRVRKMTHGDPQ
jgi:hypothetical protein